jgi:hypothetical protein
MKLSLLSVMGKLDQKMATELQLIVSHVERQEAQLRLEFTKLNE